MLEAVRDHWQEYLIEAWCLGTFMVSASFFGTLLFHPRSPAAALTFNVRNILMASAMGLTAIAIICSPWGKRSGAHFNPAVTLVFLRLGKISGTDAAFYIAAHFVGGFTGVLTSWLILSDLLAEMPVNFVATLPNAGTGPAFAVEAIISFVMMSAILFIGNSRRLSKLTPYAAGILLAIFITFTSTVSGTSLNPARTAASAIFANAWSGWWIYFTAPVLAMLSAAEIFIRTRGLKTVLCGKLRHNGKTRCIFKCGYCAERIVEATRQPHVLPYVAELL